MIELRERLKAYMGEKDLSVREVAVLLNRHPLTIWKFLRGKTAPHDQTLYQIRRSWNGWPEGINQTMIGPLGPKNAPNIREKDKNNP